MVSRQVDHAESDELISFFARESRKTLNFNYVSYLYIKAIIIHADK